LERKGKKTSRIAASSRTYIPWEKKGEGERKGNPAVQKEGGEEWRPKKPWQARMYVAGRPSLVFDDAASRKKKRGGKGRGGKEKGGTYDREESFSDPSYSERISIG